MNAKTSKPVWEPDTKKLRIKRARLSYPHLWKAWAQQPDQKPKYTASFIVPKTDPICSVIEHVLEDIIRAEFRTKSGAIKTVWHDGEDKSDRDGYGPEVMYLNANSERRPLIVDRNQEPLAEEDGRPYGGCYVNGIVRLWTQNNAWGRRVNAELLGVQFVADGEPFAGGPPARPDDFEVEEVDEDEDTDPWLS